jgi:cytochrome c553
VLPNVRREMALDTILLAVSALIATVFAVVPSSVSAQELARGEALFGLCASCHGGDAAGNQQYLAPAIAGMDQWYIEAQLRNFRSGLRGTHPDDVGGMRMRPMSLTLRAESDVEAVAAYIARLPRVSPAPFVAGGDPARGEALYVTCGACHGVNGEGNQQLNGPALTNLDDWYLLEQMRKYRVGARGGDLANLNGILMRPMALALAGDQAMKDLVAYIMTLSP